MRTEDSPIRGYEYPGATHMSISADPTNTKWITHLLRTLSVMVKYAERHSSHAKRPDSFVLMPLSAFDLS